MKAIVNENYLNSKDDLSLEELKTVSCFQNLSEKDLQETVTTIKKFTQITYEIFSRKIQEVPVIKINEYKTKAA